MREGTRAIQSHVWSSDRWVHYYYHICCIRLTEIFKTDYNYNDYYYCYDCYYRKKLYIPSSGKGKEKDQENWTAWLWRTTYFATCFQPFERLSHQDFVKVSLLNWWLFSCILWHPIMYTMCLILSKWYSLPLVVFSDNVMLTDIPILPHLSSLSLSPRLLLLVYPLSLKRRLHAIQGAFRVKLTILFVIIWVFGNFMGHKQLRFEKGGRGCRRVDEGTLRVLFPRW